jgi:hypothetical protein
MALISISRTNEQRGKGKFDIYIDDELYHDSEADGIPGPSAIEELINLLKIKTQD